VTQPVLTLIIGLPLAGLSLNGLTAELSGAPTVVENHDLTIQVGRTGGQVRPFLQAGEPCSDRPAAAIATFEDANLEAATRTALSVGAQDDLTCRLVAGLAELDAPGRTIESLAGIQNFTSLAGLDLQDNSIVNIGALVGLTNLTRLSLATNSITDISALTELTSLIALVLDNNPGLSDIGPLSGLTSLTFLWLNDNSITDIQPLLDNTGLGEGDTVDLGSTNVTCTDVAALQAKRVVVISDCPARTRVVRGRLPGSYRSPAPR
jgi:Leucine-rich repeat (LRR) protein